MFLTGDVERASEAVGRALESMPYERSEMPQTLRAPDEFSFEKYAANVGLVIVSGKRFWQRAPVHLLPTAKFDYRPSQYRPRPLPVGAALKIAAALILAFGVFTSYVEYTAQTQSVAKTASNLEYLEIRSELRAVKLVETGEARVLLDANKARTERLIAANAVLEDRDGGFADTVSVIGVIAPEGVEVTQIDDDGEIVAVSAASDEYAEMLAFVRLLEDVPQFEHVQVLSITRATGSIDDGVEPAEQAGGGVEIKMQVKASLVIRRIEIEIDDSQLFIGEELAAVTDLD